MNIDEARRRLEDRWDNQGECRSCGWHAALYEHDVTDSDLEYAIEHNDSVLELGCASVDADEGAPHRGVKVFLGLDT